MIRECNALQRFYFVWELRIPAPPPKSESHVLTLVKALTWLLRYKIAYFGISGLNK